MIEIGLFVAVAAITYGSRVVFMVRPRGIGGTANAGAISAFPLALFVSLATLGALAPSGEFEFDLAVVSAVGVATTAALTRKVGLLAVMGSGFAVFWVIRWLS